MKHTITNQCISISIALILIFLVVKIPMKALGSVTDSTPKVYLPIMMKLTTPTPKISPTATATPTSEHTPSPTPNPAQDWLTYLNWLRSLGGLPSVTENANWSDGDWLHARYMVKNDIIGHSENPSNPWYSVEGNQAAASSDLMVSSSANATDSQALDLWMRGPFHGIGILDPALNQTAFGSYRESIGMYKMGAGLDVIRGLGTIPVTVSFPIMWPIDGALMPYSYYGGNELPDPLTSCAGYTTPSGPPIYLQIGSGNQLPNVTSFSFHKDGIDLAVCEFDETNYTNPDNNMQSLGRSVLNMRDAIILMPRNPLEAGLTYSASITNNGTTYSWSFHVTGKNILSVPKSQIR